MAENGRGGFSACESMDGVRFPHAYIALQRIMTMNYIYMLKCRDGSLYTGWTNRLEERVAAHQSGRGAKYTRSRRPVELVYWECFQTRSEAMSREAAIKRMTRADKLALIGQASLPGR